MAKRPARVSEWDDINWDAGNEARARIEEPIVQKALRTFEASPEGLAAFERVLEFHHKHALGPMLPPSCLVCGETVVDPAIQHMELPGIVVCHSCRDARARQSQGRSAP